MQFLLKTQIELHKGIAFAVYLSFPSQCCWLPRVNLNLEIYKLFVRELSYILPK